MYATLLGQQKGSITFSDCTNFRKTWLRVGCAVKFDTHIISMSHTEEVTCDASRQLNLVIIDLFKVLQVL